MAVVVGMFTYTQAGGERYAPIPAKLREMTVQVLANGRAIGSGFVIDESLVCTAKHVVEAMPQARFEVKHYLPTHNATITFPVRKIKRSYTHDVAILIVDFKFKRIARLATDSAMGWGQAIFVTGGPLGLPTMATRGNFVGYPGPEAGSFIPGGKLISCQATFGNSGGPVWNANTGEVIGLLSAGPRNYAQVSLITPVEAIHKLLRQKSRAALLP